MTFAKAALKGQLKAYLVQQLWLLKKLLSASLTYERTSPISLTTSVFFL
jgi:hypothetical protein